MTRGRFYGAAMPIWAILYAIGVIALHSHVFDVVGALAFALIAVLGATLIRPEPGVGRQRDRSRRRARRSG